MKVKLENFEVEIGAVTETRFDRDETRWFLSYLANAFSDAARYQEGLGHHYTALGLEKAVRGIWEAEDEWDAEHQKEAV